MSLKSLKELKEFFDEYRERLDNQGVLSRICENETLMCAIITLDKHKAESIMEEKGAVKLFESSKGIDWKLDGEIWMWRYWDRVSIRCRLRKIIVDKDIDDGLFKLFMPLLANSCFSIDII